MNHESKLLDAKQNLVRLCNTNDVIEMGASILERMKDIVYIVDRTVYTVAFYTDNMVSKVLQPLHHFLKCFYDELAHAVNNPSYVFRCIDEQALPDLLNLDESQKSAIKSVVQTMDETLPTMMFLMSSLQKTAYPYTREIRITLNTLAGFTSKLSL